MAHGAPPAGMGSETLETCPGRLQLSHVDTLGEPSDPPPRPPANVPLNWSPHTLAFHCVSIHTSQPLWDQASAETTSLIEKKILRDMLN